MPSRRDEIEDAQDAQEDKDGNLQSPRDSENPAAQHDEAGADTSSEEDGHLGATEEQVSETPAPAGDGFDDEPRQG